MNRATRIVACCFAVVIAIATVVLIVSSIRAVNSLNQLIQRGSTELQAAAVDRAAVEKFITVELPDARAELKKFVSESHSALREAVLTEGQLRHASANERAQLEKQNIQITGTIAAVKELVSNTDAGINRNLIPAATESLNDSRKALQATTETVRDVNAGLKPVLENAAADMAQANKLLSDPAMLQTLHNLQQSSSNLVDTTAQAKEGLQVAVDAEKQLFARALAPASAVKGALLFTARLVGRFFGL